MKYLPALRLTTVVTLCALVLIATTSVRGQVANISEIQQAAVGLSALPPRLGEDGSLTGEPGATIQTEVRVRNVTNETIRVQTLAEDFVIGDDGRTPIPVDISIDSRFSLASWIELPVQSAVVTAGSTQTIPVVIRVPEDARPGGRYAMIMHEPIVGEGVEFDADLAGRASIQPRVGTLVYFRVPGPVHEEAVIRNIQVPGFSEFGPVPISFDVENLSDIHIQPLTQIEIKDILGRTVDTILVETQNVYPYSLRQFRAEWDRVWGFGRYSAHFRTAYDESGLSTTATVSFWLLPYRLIIAILVALLAVVAAGIVIRRHLRYRNSVDKHHVELLEDRIRQLEHELHGKDSQ